MSARIQVKTVKYSEILELDRIVHFSQKDIKVEYDYPMVNCGPADQALVVFCHNGEGSLLERQCVASNLRFVKLGRDIRHWINTYKPFLFFDFLSANQENLADTIVLFLDAYDVILPRSLLALIERYRRSYYGLALFNATNASMNSGIISYQRRKIDGFENRLCGGGKFYLNAGVVMGDCGSLFDVYRNVVELMVELYPFPFRNHQYKIRTRNRALKREQPFIRLAGFRNQGKVALDYNNEITIRLRPAIATHPNGCGAGGAKLASPDLQAD
ncbi:MAG TPA: hypothetical protein VFE51_07735 [Verrucomicrobiae bacterium]|nr:hypothetical protein [Verrucomicrobiae bacterium]